MTAAATATAGRAGRHRSEAVDRVILEAALAVLREHGYEGLTMLGVIERAGVSSASLYRRWRTKEELVTAALESITIDVVTDDTGSLAGDLASLAHRTAEVFEEHGALFGRLSSELYGNVKVNDALRERLLAPRIRELHAILVRAHERGELPRRVRPNAEEVLSLLTGPLQHRALVLGQPLGRAFVRAAVQQTVNYLTQA